MEIGQLFEWQCFYLLGPETKRGRMARRMPMVRRPKAFGETSCRLTAAPIQA